MVLPYINMNPPQILYLLRHTGAGSSCIFYNMRPKKKKKKKKNLGFSLLLYRYIHSNLLPLVAEFLSFDVYLLWFLATHQAATVNFCFSKGGIIAQVCTFSLAHRSWHIFWMYFLSTVSCPFFCTRSCLSVAGGVCLAPATCRPSKKILRWGTFRSSRVWTSYWSLLWRMQELHSFNALWYCYLPISLSSLSSKS